MPGRKQPETTEQEQDREYYMTEKRAAGEDVGPMTGEAGKVEAEREKWASDREAHSRQDL